MSHDRAEYFSDWKTRIQRASKDWRCDACGGTIRKGTSYLNHDDRARKRRWQGREHIDCTAPWWQVDITHLLTSLSELPHDNPPASEVVPILEDIPVTVIAATARINQVSWQLPSDYRQRLLHTPDPQKRTAAMTEIELAIGLLVDCIMRVSGQKEAALQLSHIMQQMQQVAKTATANTLHSRKTDQANS